MDTKLLKNLGLEEKAAKIYLAGLSLGATSVQELARKSGLKRPTVYLYLDDLVRRGMFEYVSINRKKYYRALDPQFLEKALERNLTLVREEMPKLLALRADTAGRPQVQVFEGEEGIRRVYEEMREAHSARFWSNIGELHGSYHIAHMQLSKAFHKNGTNIREIIAETKESRRYAKLVAKVIGPTYSARTATQEGLHDDAVVYDNVVAFFCLFAIHFFFLPVEDPAIADSMRAMFDMAWKTARPRSEEH